MVRFVMVHRGSGGDGPLRPDATGMKAVRSQAMRHFRKGQQRARRTEPGPLRPVAPASLRTRWRLNSTARGNVTSHNHDGDHLALKQDPPGGGAAAEASTLANVNAGECDKTASYVHRPVEGAELHRYVLAEMFGSHLLGGGTRRPRSAGILCFRGYVATTESDLVRASDDTLCLMLPACMPPNPRILVDARKRHIAALQHMQHVVATTGRVDDIDNDLAAISGAVELLFIDMFKPVSLGEGRLYTGLCHLLSSRQQSLIRSQAPLASWLLIQLRQVMLLEALASRKSLPVTSDIFRSIPWTTSLIPPATEALMQMAIGLPQLLERASEAVRDPTSNKSSVLEQLLTLERGLAAWQHEYIDPHQPVLSERDEVVWNCQSRAMQNICLLHLRESVAQIAEEAEDQSLKKDYTRHAKRTADTLCATAECFMRSADGVLSKALSVYAPLYFAHRWFETNDIQDRAAFANSQIETLQEEIPFLSWRELLRWSLPSMYMNG